MSPLESIAFSPADSFEQSIHFRSLEIFAAWLGLCILVKVSPALYTDPIVCTASNGLDENYVLVCVN